MAVSKAARLAGALDDFITQSVDVEAAAVVSFDGLTLAAALPPEMDEDRLGAMSAALLSLGEQAASGLGRGLLNQIFVEGEHGYVFLMSAQDQAVLAAVTNRSAKIGFMLYEMRRAAAVIGDLLAEPTAAAGDQLDRHLAPVPAVEPPPVASPEATQRPDEPEEPAVTVPWSTGASEAR